MQEPALGSAGLDLDFSSVAGAPTPSERLVPAAIGRGRCELSLTGYTAAKRMEIVREESPSKACGAFGQPGAGGEIPPTPGLAAGAPKSGAPPGGSAGAVRAAEGGVERRQHRRQRVGGLLGEPMARAREHDALDVLGDVRHRNGDAPTGALRSADREDVRGERARGERE